MLGVDFGPQVSERRREKAIFGHFIFRYFSIFRTLAANGLIFCTAPPGGASDPPAKFQTDAVSGS
jgi:hypothetical protein